MVRASRFKSIGLLLILLFITFSLYSQSDIDPPFPEFDSFKKWGYHMGGMIYSPTQNVNPTGPYTLEHIPQLGFSVGFTKLINGSGKISYKTGIYYQSTPVYKVDIAFKGDDTFFRGTDGFITTLSRFNFAIPLFIQIKPCSTHKCNRPR